MKYLLLLLFVVCLVVGCKKETPNTSTRQPNILLIIADDLGIDATPGYTIGDIKPHMPHLSMLANNGITFDNVWAYPVCSPTRSSILTGKYGYRTGVLNAESKSTIDVSEKTLHSYLDDETNNQYSHAIIGKWHLSNNEPMRPTQMGIGYYAGLLGGGVSDYNNWPLTENGATMAYSGYITTKVTDLAIDWINEQSSPWFCWLAYTAPHTPFHLPPNEMHNQGNLPNDQASIDANPTPYFMAMNESIDYEIGRLLEDIPPAELDNTLIIFIGDNGTHAPVLQAPYSSGQNKGSLYQGGIHVPMIVSGKGVSRVNERDDNLIHSADLFTTIAQVAGSEVNHKNDSYSFMPLLTTAGEGSRLFNYSEIEGDSPNKSGYTIRNKQYKLIVFNSGQRRFYDLSADPYEENPLPILQLTGEREAAFNLLLQKAGEIRE